MSNLISASDLHSLITTDADHVRIIDCRFKLTDPQAGRALYSEGHLPSAQFFDLDVDLSVPPAANGHGGRHPLPPIDAFEKRSQAAGISQDTTVIAYDDAGGLFAGRLWWMLKYLGHDDVKLLDGGIQAWQAADYELTTAMPTFAPSAFQASPRPEMLASIDEVKRNLDVPDVLLVDARGAERYRGDTEPMDKQAGHIPSAINLPFADNLQDGTFKDIDTLTARFEDLTEAETVIVYCGSGVSAAHNVLAMDEVGIKNTKLYVGSWSDWSSREDTPVATGEEP
ncbi:MAG: sulfurtransferase [Deinococcota bacterium]